MSPKARSAASTRDVRPEAAFDRFYTVLRVHGGDAILTDNWHTNEVLNHARNNFEGVHLCHAHAGGVGGDDRE